MMIMIWRLFLKKVHLFKSTKSEEEEEEEEELLNDKT